jgi:RNA polymerase sigma factor (sigma-70 family)
MPFVMLCPASWEQALPVLRHRLVRRARRLGVDAAAAEDLAQDALYEAWRLRGRIYDPAGVDRWVDAIFSNVYRRSMQRTGREQAARSGTTSSEVDVADDYDLELELERGELRDLLDRALSMLPAETRQVLIGRFVEETPLSDLAGQLGLAPGALRMRLQRGKLALRSVLTTTYAEDAVSLGLLDEAEAGWQETRIWCPGCGTARLRGRFRGHQRGVEFVCPHDQRSWWVIQPDTTAFGVTGFRATFKRVGSGAYNFWLDRLRGCDEHPHPRTVTWDDNGVLNRSGPSATPVNSRP